MTGDRFELIKREAIKETVSLYHFKEVGQHIETMIS
jgi:hypothetical protein